MIIVFILIQKIIRILLILKVENSNSKIIKFNINNNSQKLIKKLDKNFNQKNYLDI